MNFLSLTKSVFEGTLFVVDGVKLVRLTNCFSDEDLNNINKVYDTDPEHVVTSYSMNKKDWPFELDKSSAEYQLFLDAVNAKLGTNFDHYVGRIWQEEAGHHMGMHVDNDMVCGSMQIYLPSTADENTGTVFYNKGDPTLQFKFKPNTGYLCADPRKIFHSTGDPVAENKFRRSAYFIFRNA